MIMSYQPSKIWHAYYDFLANQAAASQSSCKVVTTLYLFCIKKIIFSLIYDLTVILPKNDNELSTVKNLTCILWFFCKPGSHLTIQLQSSYHTIFLLHWRKNIVHNLWCYHNPTCRGYKVINCYLSVIMLQQVHERRIAKSDFPQFPDEGCQSQKRGQTKYRINHTNNYV